MRERSVVRSSVIPSAKYSWSGSFDRLLKGRTTIERRGAGVLVTAGGICRLATAGAWTDTTDDSGLGHPHQARVPTAVAATTLVAIRKYCGLIPRRTGPGCVGAPTR